MSETKTKKLKKKTLRGRFIGALILLALVISIAVSALVSKIYYDNQVYMFGEISFAVARTVSSHIEGDRIQGYLENKDKDEHYNDIQVLMEKLKTEFDIEYIYVFVPGENEFTYIWDTEEGTLIGEKENDISDKEREQLPKLLAGEETEFMINYSNKYGFFGTAWAPVYDSAGKIVAVVGVDYFMLKFLVMIILYAVYVTLLVAFITALAGFIYYRGIKRNIIRPIVLLNNATKDMVENIDKDVQFDVDIHTRDEIEDLADSFAKMDIDLRTYIKELEHVTAEKERIGAELNVATKIQADMLPRNFPAFPERKDIDIYASMTPAKEVGGDFYDFFLVDDNHIALVMADVSGKGVPAALFMVIAKTLIKNSLLDGSSPAEALSNANNQLCEGNDSDMFVTVWLAVIDLTTGKGMAANAGHEHPAIRRVDGNYELEVYRHSIAVATMEGIPFKEHEFALNAGDSLFVYTDGVAEATNADNELFGTERMLTALNEEPDAEPERVLENVMRGIDDFVEEAEQFDDITMLCFRYNGVK